MLESLLSTLSTERGTRAALAYEGDTLTFRALSAAADRLAAALAVNEGERVAVVAPNVPALVIALFATWRAGAVAVLLNARLRQFELTRAFADAEPAATVSLRAHAGYELAREIRTLSERVRTVRSCVVTDKLGRIVDESWLGGARGSLPSDRDLAAILYTSGTSGDPKGALVPRQLAYAEALNVAELLGDEADAPYGLVVPATHAFGLACLLGGMVGAGCAVLVDSTSSLDPLLEALERHAALVLHGTPTLFGRLLRSGATLGVRIGLTAGSWCPPELLQALDERGLRLLNLYGMTEIGAATSCRVQDPPATRYRTVGRALPGYELRAAAGEVQVRSSLLPSGYHGRPFSEDE
ncbi:MAG: acyl--CoA ligase [Solirubrobacterales bacterium]|nr:acyl--CoA ligase [Solirubrobacterales bacterium]